MNLFIIYAVVFWIGPHLSGYRYSYYRSDACLVPALACVWNAPPPVLRVFLAAAVLLAFYMSRQFFLGILV